MLNVFDLHFNMNYAPHLYGLHLDKAVRCHGRGVWEGKRTSDVGICWSVWRETEIIE